MSSFKFSKDEKKIFKGLNGFSLLMDTFEELYEKDNGCKTLSALNDPNIKVLLKVAKIQNAQERVSK